MINVDVFLKVNLSYSQNLSFNSLIAQHYNVESNATSLYHLSSLVQHLYYGGCQPMEISEKEDWGKKVKNN